MFYLPYKSDQEAEARQLMVQMFELVFPKKIAEVVVKRDVKFIYDPATHELAQVVMPFYTKYEVDHLDIGQRLGHQGLSRGCKTTSRRPPHNVRTSGR